MRGYGGDDFLPSLSTDRLFPSTSSIVIASSPHAIAERAQNDSPAPAPLQLIDPAPPSYLLCRPSVTLHPSFCPPPGPSRRRLLPFLSFSPPRRFTMGSAFTKVFARMFGKAKQAAHTAVRVKRSSSDRHTTSRPVGNTPCFVRGVSTYSHCVDCIRPTCCREALVVFESDVTPSMHNGCQSFHTSSPSVAATSTRSDVGRLTMDSSMLTRHRCMLTILCHHPLLLCVVLWLSAERDAYSHGRFGCRW